MIGPIIQLLLATGYATGALWFIYHKCNEESKREKETPSNLSEREAKINSIELVSANYKGNKKVSGEGIHVSSYGYDWDTCEYKLKSEAAKANCNIVLDVTKKGNRQRGFRFEGIAYRKG